MILIGYARVSTINQNEDRQIQELIKYGVEEKRIYIDETDIRLNNGYGKYLYNKGRFAESEKYFRQAIKSSDEANEVRNQRIW